MGHFIVLCTFFYIFWSLQILLISASTPIDELYLQSDVDEAIPEDVHGAVLVYGVVPGARNHCQALQVVVGLQLIPGLRVVFDSIYVACSWQAAVRKATVSFTFEPTFHWESLS